MGVVRVAQLVFVQGLSACPLLAAQSVRVTGRRGLAAARKLNLNRVAPWPCLCKDRV